MQLNPSLSALDKVATVSQLKALVDAYGGLGEQPAPKDKPAWLCALAAVVGTRDSFSHPNANLMKLVCVRESDGDSEPGDARAAGPVTE